MISTLPVSVRQLLLVTLLFCAGPVACGLSFGHQGIQTSHAPAIIGGSVATGSEEFSKSTVAIYNVESGSLCTGSLLSAQTVLTAAHCVDADPDDLRILVGTNLDSDSALIFPVEQSLVSPLWSTRKIENIDRGDIAVLSFTGQLPADYKSIALLDDKTQLHDDDSLLLVGYGSSDPIKNDGVAILRAVESTIKSVRFSPSEILVRQTSTNGVCHGDSGGPALIRLNGVLTVVGIVDRGQNDAADDCAVEAVIFTDIAYYQDWIVSASQQLSSGQ